MFQPLQYSRNLEPLVNIARILFQKHGKLMKWSSEAESILDLGIGDGRITKEVILPIVPRNVKEYIGADISEPMLQYAQKILQHENFKTIQLDITTENIPQELKNRFHHIIANFLFHHVPNISQALQNIRDMLKPGGQLFFNALSKSFLEDAYEILEEGKWSKYNNRKAHSPFYKSENVIKEYETVIKSLGYVDCHYFMELFKPRMPKESFEEFMVAGNSRLRYVSEEDKEEYIKDYSAAVKKGKLITQITDVKSGKIEYELIANFITGVISKPI